VGTILAGLKQPGSEAYHSPLPSAGVKKA